MAEGWKDDPDTLPLFKTLIQSEKDSNVRFAAIETLAERWKDDPNVFIFLCDRAKDDPFERKEARGNNPRLSALMAVARRYPYSSKDSSSPVFLLLNDRLENDPDEQVRKFASKKLQIWEGIK